MTSTPFDLPNSLNLPPHLSAQKYFFVCTLTVAAWDTLVLSPRTWRLLKTPGWPALKVLFHFLRIFMPVEFVVVGENVVWSLSSSAVVTLLVAAVAFFDTKWPQSVSKHIGLLILYSRPHFQTCQKFYLFEPICTAILLAATSGQLLRLISTDRVPL